MTEWRECKLGDVINLKRGYDLPQQRRKTGPFPIVSSSGITDYHIEAKVKGPGVVTGRYGTLGEVFYIQGDFWPLNTSLYVQDFKGSDPRFVSFFLRQLNFGTKNAAGAVPGVNRNHLHAMDVRIPSLPVQRRISGILSAYDDLIENNQRRIKILEEMTRSLYREWFVHFRFPGHDKTKMVPSPLGPIPQGWEVLPLEAVCARITDGAHHSPKSVDVGFPMASVKDMHDWGFNVDGCRRINEEDYTYLVRNDCKPKKDDILIAKDGSYLKHTFVVGEEKELVILSSIAILRANSRIFPNYLNFILRDPNTKARMKGFVSGVALPRIILKEFRKFQVIVASKSIQASWSELVNPMVDLCRSHIARNENLRRTRDLLLPRLLSGQMDIEAL